jgi:hypothetical protein
MLCPFVLQAPEEPFGDRLTLQLPVLDSEQVMPGVRMLIGD